MRVVGKPHWGAGALFAEELPQTYTALILNCWFLIVFSGKLLGIRAAHSLAKTVT